MPSQDPEYTGEKQAVHYLPPAVSDFVSDQRAHEVGDNMALQVHVVTSRKSHLDTYQGEFQHYKKSCETLQIALVDSASTPPITCPLKVITAGKFVNEDRALTEEEQALSKKWNEGQANLLKRSSKSEQIIAEKSDHMIMHNEPESITTAVQAALTRTKQ